MSAKVPLKVIIVGAGIGGTAAAVALGRQGHDVTLLESAPKLLEIGAGIQVAPNMLMLLDRWGVGSAVRKTGVSLECVRILRWQNGKELGRIPMEKTYGDQVVVHRADLHNGLLDKAREMTNVQVQIDATVVGVDCDTATVTLKSGEVIQGDVVIGADGIKSSLRSQVLQDSADIAIPTGDAVYRLMLSRDVMENDADLRPFIMEPRATRWIGPERHIIAYPVRSHQLYNVVMAHPDRGGLEESWTTMGSKKGLLGDYEGWDPNLVKMLNLVPDQEVLEWKLCSHPPLPTWVRGSVALLGDACHPMLPYVAQGAAQAVEDAAALGILLSHISSKSEIPTALQTYEQNRKARAERVQQFGTSTRDALHLPDGPAQEARDQQFAELSSSGNRADRWVDPATQQYLWTWDSEQKAGEAWQRMLTP